MSPYDGIAKSGWPGKTAELVEKHPWSKAEIVEVVLACWDEIFDSRIGSLRIGQDIFPTPQAMGLFLHHLIPHAFSAKYPKQWRKETEKNDKDMVYIPDSLYSTELKTSSHGSQIFGNRSYAQKETGASKSKDGYYLAVNFGKFGSSNNSRRPQIRKIRFGWLDHSDWIAQAAATGQQAHLAPDTYTSKFQLLYEPG